MIFFGGKQKGKMTTTTQSYKGQKRCVKKVIKIPI